MIINVELLMFHMVTNVFIWTEGSMWKIYQIVGVTLTDRCIYRPTLVYGNIVMDSIELTKSARFWVHSFSVHVNNVKSGLTPHPPHPKQLPPHTLTNPTIPTSPEDQVTIRPYQTRTYLTVPEVALSLDNSMHLSKYLLITSSIH